MASIEKRQRAAGGKVTWRAIYRTPEGKQRSKSFDRKADAVRFLTSIESVKLTGSYVDPSRSVVTLGDLARTWLAGKVNLKPSTWERYAVIIRVQIEPRWGGVRLADLTHSAVQSWVGELTATRSAATVRKVHGVLSLILASAVRDGRLARNPSEGISLPRVATAERTYLTHEQVAGLADASGDYRLAVLFLAYTGVRFGELAALRVGRLDLMRRRATVAESVTEVSGRGMVWGTPKGHERRDVPIPRFLVNDLARHVAGRPADALVFTAPQGRVLRVRNFRRVALDPAAHRVRRRREGRSADARAQVGDHDPRPVWPPVRRPPRRCGRRDGRGTHRGASPCCPFVAHDRGNRTRHGASAGYIEVSTGCLVVETRGLEPLTPALQRRCSTT